MIEIKSMFKQTVEALMTILNGAPKRQVIFQEVQQDWWNVKPTQSNHPAEINNGIRRM
jgi:hypothetical protein